MTIIYYIRLKNFDNNGSCFTKECNNPTADALTIIGNAYPTDTSLGYITLKCITAPDLLDSSSGASPSSDGADVSIATVAAASAASPQKRKLGNFGPSLTDLCPEVKAAPRFALSSLRNCICSVSPKTVFCQLR